MRQLILTLVAGLTIAALPAPALAKTETAVLAGGCFWGMEAVFEHVKGVSDVTAGYAGGAARDATYDLVSAERTGHAEAVRIRFDPAKVSYAKLLHIYFTVAHDPTQLNRQGPDVGTHYRSAIFYATDSQKRIAKAYVDQLTKAKSFSRPIVTEVSPLDRFNVAEDYHQDYASLHPYQPYIMIHDAPKVANLKREFAALYVEPRKR